MALFSCIVNIAHLDRLTIDHSVNIAINGNTSTFERNGLHVNVVSFDLLICVQIACMKQSAYHTPSLKL